ncbi:MAG: shikimate dehydrogenase [Planctomycetota bacterium]
MADICVASHHTSLAELLADEEFYMLSQRDGFLIELRLDYYSDLTLDNFNVALNVFAPKAIVTYRHPAEDGRRTNVSDSERLSYLQRAAEAGAKYIDIETRTPHADFKKHQSQLILSFHDFEQALDSYELRRRREEMNADAEADIIKIACRSDNIQDTAPLLSLLTDNAALKPLIALAMGESGFWTRVVGPLFGSPLTYARGERAPGTAAGQPTWRELEENYRFHQLKPGWPVYGVIGNPITHSLSPLMHNTALRKMGLDGVYLPFRVEGDPIEFVNTFASALGIKALSVTIPHKETMLKICSEVHELARMIGAVNTILLNSNGAWYGANTDAFAAADALEEVIGSLRGKNVLVLGAGGAAKAVAFGVKVRGAHVFVANRTIEHAVALAAAVGGKMIRYDELDGRPNFAAVINTTSVGMFPDTQQTPLKKEQIPESSIVFDTVYNPLRTKLLKLAQEKGCEVLEGVTMFVRQGACQFELYSGAKAPREAMKQVVLAALKNARLLSEPRALASGRAVKRIAP